MSTTRYCHARGMLLLWCLLLMFVVTACGRVSDFTSTSPNAASNGDTSTTVALASLSPIAEHESPVALSSPPSSVLDSQPYPPGTTIAGIDVGGLRREDAANKLRLELSPIERPLQLYVGKTQHTITASHIDLTFHIEEMLTEASDALDSADVQGKPVHIPLHITFDQAALRRHIRRFAKQTLVAPKLHVLQKSVPLTSVLAINETNNIEAPYFAYTPGYTLNIEDTIEDITKRLNNPRASHHIELTLAEDTNTNIPRPDNALLKQQIYAIMEQWQDGTIGYYQYDLQRGTHLGINEHTVFSGASVMKAAILLHAYVSLPHFTKQQHEWIEQMIIHSSNIAANYVLAISIGGSSSYDAYNATQHMTAMLQKLGLDHTYQKGAYSVTYPELSGMSFAVLYPIEPITPEEDPPPTPELYDMEDGITPTPYTYQQQEGNPPYTNADLYLRTTPSEMSQIFLLMDQCSRGEGPLIALFDKTINADRCQEMLDVLAQNGDTKRIRAGLPADVRVEHKSGWIDDMQADVGIVRSQGGDFVLAIFLYQGYFLEDGVAHPIIAALTRLTYTAYNPVKHTASK